MLCIRACIACSAVSFTQIIIVGSQQHQCSSVTVSRSVGSALNCSPSVRLTDTRLASMPTIRSTAEIASSRRNADRTKNLFGEPPPGLTSTIQAALLWAVCAPGHGRAGTEGLEKARLLAMGPPLIATGGSKFSLSQPVTPDERVSPIVGQQPKLQKVPNRLKIPAWAEWKSPFALMPAASAGPLNALARASKWKRCACACVE